MKAYADVSLCLHNLKTNFSNEGVFKIKAALYYEDNQKFRIQAPLCHIIRRSNLKLFPADCKQYQSQPVFISLSDDWCNINQTCMFRIGIDVQQLQHIELYCKIDLLFSIDVYLDFTEQRYTKFADSIVKINKLSILQYLPVTFDDFDGTILTALYNSNICQFRFSKNHQHSNSLPYFSAVTNQFDRKLTEDFYQYYRNYLEEELNAINDKILKIRQIQGETVNIQSKLFIFKNKEILVLINQLKPKVTIQFKNYLMEQILKDYSSTKVILRNCYQQLGQLIRKTISIILPHFKQLYEVRVSDKLSINVFSRQVKNVDCRISEYQNESELNLQQAALFKNKNQINLWDDLVIYNPHYCLSLDQCPKLFHSCYLFNKSKITSKDTHVIVLVHGFQASRNDLFCFKSFLLNRFTNIQVLVSCVNQSKTNLKIQQQAKNLSEEILSFVEHKLYKKTYRLSLVGHSMGGIVIRAALPYLPSNIRYETLMTLSSPHLGYLNNESSIVEAGLWYLNSWQKIDSIGQITMNDKSNYTDTFMYRLSQSTTMRRFKNIVLIGSSQDKFVPFESARIQKSTSMLKNFHKGDRNAKISCSMVDNLLGAEMKSNLHRIDVIFEMDLNWDKVLGRAAHIRLLSDNKFLRLLVNIFSQWFH